MMMMMMIQSEFLSQWGSENHPHKSCDDSHIKDADDNNDDNGDDEEDNYGVCHEDDDEQRCQ